MNLINRTINTCRLFLAFFLLTAGLTARAGNDYKEEAAYMELRDSMTAAFNDGDSARFFHAVGQLENYLLEQNDLHAYYTQRCNEIVFLLNQQSIFEAYKLSMKLSKELRERKLDKELYMAINMMGHIYNYCGNKDSARKCFKEVLRRMKEAGYEESMPPIYMNLVQVEMDEDPQEAMRLLDEAARISSTPQRRVDVEAYRTLYYYKQGDRDRFVEGYKSYKKSEAEGMNSVHGRELEAAWLTLQGDLEGALRIAGARSGATERYSAMADVYEHMGQWERACAMLHLKEQAADSVNSVILGNSMQGIQNELQLSEAEHRANRMRLVALLVTIGVLLLLIGALVYILLSRRRHLHELQVAHDRAMESDRLKSAFIRNVSHELRTPLNIISGFTQVLTNTDFEVTPEERQDIGRQVADNTQLITSLVDEMLELSLNDTSQRVDKPDNVPCNKLCRALIDEFAHAGGGATTWYFESKVGADYRLHTNNDMLAKIIRALLDNAKKNTPAGTVTLRLSTADGHALFSVEDTGAGVPQGEAERIFERFVKLDNFKEGLGLGLSLSRSMARRLGGDVTLDTSYRAGARFVLSLPEQP